MIGHEKHVKGGHALTWVLSTFVKYHSMIKLIIHPSIVEAHDVKVIGMESSSPKCNRQRHKQVSTTNKAQRFLEETGVKLTLAQERGFPNL